MSSSEYRIKVALCLVLKITGKLLVYNHWFSCNIDGSNLSDPNSQPSNLQIRKSHRIDIIYSGELQEEGSSDCGFTKYNSSQGSHSSTDLGGLILLICFPKARHADYPEVLMPAQLPC